MKKSLVLGTLLLIVGSPSINHISTFLQKNNKIVNSDLKSTSARNNWNSERDYWDSYDTHWEGNNEQTYTLDKTIKYAGDFNVTNLKRKADFYRYDKEFSWGFGGFGFRWVEYIDHKEFTPQSYEYDDINKTLKLRDWKEVSSDTEKTGHTSQFSIDDKIEEIEVSGELEYNYWVTDQYDFGKDVYDIDKTNHNLISRKYKNGQKLSTDSKPYFDHNNTYMDVENYIRNNKLIASENDTPLEQAKLVFYDDKNEEINKEQNLDTSEINLKLVALPNSSNDFIGESKILNLDIPYFDISGETHQNNLYDFDELNEENNSDPTDNQRLGEWIWENNIWTFRTNNSIDLLFNERNIIQYGIDGTYYDLFSGETLELINTQVIDNKSQNYEKEITLVNKQGFEFNFKFDFRTDVFNENNIQIKTFNDDEYLIAKDKIKVFDENKDSNVQGKEILLSNTVTSNFWVNNSGEKYTAYKWDSSLENWSEIQNNEMQQQGYQFNEKGIYGFSSIDGYGNNSFEVVEYVDNSQNSVLENWDYHIADYSKNVNLAIQQGIENYSQLSVHEMRMINEKNSCEEIKDLSRIAISFENLEQVTNQFESNKEFKYIKTSLESEIKKELDKSQISENSYLIEWENIADNDLLTTGKTIEFKLIPSGDWKTKGEFEGEFESKTFNNLSQIKLPTQSLVDRTNNYETGRSFKSVRNGLEDEINSYLGSIMIPVKNLHYKWNLSDSYLMQGNEKIEYWISVTNDETFKGTIHDQFTSENYFNLNSFSADNDKLLEITNKRYGNTFGSYRSKLESEIANQLREQNYSYSSDYIEIIWNFDDDQIIAKGDSVEFRLRTKNSRFVQNDYIGKINWGFMPPNTKDKVKLYAGFFGIFLLMLSLIILIATYSGYKKKRTRRERAQMSQKHNSKIKGSFDYLNSENDFSLGTEE